jgi:glycosyltransferase involved in cell wall biosynthesis
MFRLAYIVTHPIQYQAPLLRLLAASREIELKVFFLSDFSLHAHHEKAFGQTFKWDVNLTDGYNWEVLPRWGIGRSTSLRPWWPVSGVKQRLQEGNFDAVWVHGWAHVGLRQAISAAHALGLPVLLRGESTPDPQPNTTLRRRLRDAFCRRLFRRVEGYLCIGSLNREFYRGFGVPEERLFSMPYAVDNLWFQARSSEAAAKRETFRKESGLEPGRLVILFAAKFIPVKAPGDLIAAFLKAEIGKAESRNPERKAEILPGEVANQRLHRPENTETLKEEVGGQWSVASGQGGGRKPYLLFVGDGPLRGELEQQAGALKGNDVRFLGFRNQSELPAVYDLCDIFVLPSHHEPWGLVINEVMNAGKPVIVSDCVGAAPDLVKHGVNGWVFPHGDVAALSRCLAEAFNGSDLRDMGRRSLEIINGWDFEADLKGLLEALKAVVKRRPET